MAVPDTDSFSLQDVVNEISPTTDDLQDCVNDALEVNYDSTYYTSPATSLLEFRNYGNVVLVEITGHNNTNGYDEIRLFLSSTTTESFTLEGSYDELTWNPRIIYNSGGFSTEYYDITINPGTNVYYFRIVMDSGAIGSTYTWAYYP